VQDFPETDDIVLCLQTAGGGRLAISFAQPMQHYLHEGWRRGYQATPPP
jgi:hypothetical protein